MMRRSPTAAWTDGASSRSRSVLATVERARPTRAAICSGLKPNSSISRRKPSGGLDRVEVLALQVLDERDLELGLIVELADDAPGCARGRRPRRRAGAARRRRAGSRRCVSVTRIGCRTPCSRMLSVSVASSASSKRRRGWCGFGRIAVDRDVGRAAAGRRCAAGSASTGRGRGRGRVRGEPS